MNRRRPSPPEPIVRERVWVEDGVAHRIHGGMSVGCWRPITPDGEYLRVGDPDRYVPLFCAECWPQTLRAVA